jgi:hypothetical protein
MLINTYQTLGKPEKPLANPSSLDSTGSMIRPGFLDSESRRDLIELARDGSAAHRLARRAHALVLLDDGMSCEAIAKVLFLDDDTIRTWYLLDQEVGIEGLASFGHEGGVCRLALEQQDNMPGLLNRNLLPARSSFGLRSAGRTSQPPRHLVRVMDETANLSFGLAMVPQVPRPFRHNGLKGQGTDARR